MAATNGNGRRLIIFMAGVLGLGIASAIGIGSATATTPRQISAQLSSNVVTALAGQNVTLRTPPANANPAVSAAAAVNSNAVQSSSDIVSEELVELTGPMTQAKPVLAWAIQEKISQQVSSAALSPPGGVNGQVDALAGGQESPHPSLSPPALRAAPGEGLSSGTVLGTHHGQRAARRASASEALR